MIDFHFLVYLLIIYEISIFSIIFEHLLPITSSISSRGLNSDYLWPIDYLVQYFKFLTQLTDSLVQVFFFGFLEVAFPFQNSN